MGGEKAAQNESSGEPGCHSRQLPLFAAGVSLGRDESYISSAETAPAKQQPLLSQQICERTLL